MTYSLLNADEARSRPGGVSSSRLFAISVAVFGTILLGSYPSTWAARGALWAVGAATILAVLGEGLVWIGMWA